MMREMFSKRSLWLILLIALCSFPVKGQTDDWESFWERVIADEDYDFDYATISYLYEEFCDLHENPLNINTITQEQLEQLRFLTTEQIASLLKYVERYGPLQQLGELQMVDGLNRTARKLLSFFVYPGEVKPRKTTLNEVFKYGHHQVLTRVDVPLYERAGYKSYSDSILARYPNRKYQGDPYYHSLRYQFNYANKVFFGFVGEKDAGEPFFAKNNKEGYDFYSYYLMLKDLGRLKALVLGNYRAGFGLGLVINNNFSIGKASALTNMESYQGGLRKHSSTSEYNYLRGIGATYQVGRCDLTAFYSYNHIDATLATDTTVMAEPYITSFKSDGLHRTQLEISKKGNVANQLIGGDLTYSHRGFHVGVTAVANEFDTYLNPSDDDYKAYYARGKRFYAMGAHYNYFHHAFVFSGETAYCNGGGVATLNSVQLNLLQDYKFTFIQRYYAKDYNALYAQSFCDSSVQNEVGYYVGIDATPFKYWRFKGYIDSFRFPYMKYQISYLNTRGFDAMVQAEYEKSERWRFQGKYRYKSKAKDFTISELDAYGVAPQWTQKITLLWQYTPTPTLDLRTWIDYAQVDFLTQTQSDIGYMLTQQVSYNPTKLPLNIDASVAYFDSDSYSSRLYRYEKGLLYAYSSSSFYYQGARAMLRIRYQWGEHILVCAKYGCTHYYDRDTIGTSTQLIEGKTKQDIQFQLKIKL